jgi:RNA polymerase sigma factor (sigma-70 family)
VGENGTCVAKSAQELLEEFQQTGSQQPFEEIARRYAGMVYNVALRVTRDGHDAEDATQATFLTLAVHAKTAGKIRFVGPWLKKVSHRLALDIRRSKKRRTAREQRHAEGNGHANGDGNGYELPASNNMQVDELRHILREEIDKLPSKYRLPLILYYFGGLSPDEMSKELQVNTSTLGVRLHRGRKMLAESLQHRGINMNAAAVAAILSSTIDNFVRDSLVHACSHAAVHVGSAGHVANAVVSDHVISLMHSATAALRWARLKAAVAVIALVASLLAGANQVLAKYDMGVPSLNLLNPLRLIRPLMDRMFQMPRLSADANPPASQEEETFATVDPSNSFNLFIPAYDDFSLAQSWPGQSPSGLDLPQLLQRADSATSTVESIRAMASRYAQPGGGAAITLSPPVLPAAGPRITTTPITALALSSAPQAVALNTPIPGMVVDRISGNTAAPDGRYVLSHGQITTPRLVVGDVSQGQFVMNDGRLATPALTVGRQRGSTGRFELNDGEVIASAITVGDAGVGEFVQRSGAVIASGNKPGTLTIGAQPGSSGVYDQRGGTLFSDTLLVGKQGKGTLKISNGGTTTVSVARLGYGSSGEGTLSLLDGHLQTVTPSDPTIVTSVLDSAIESPAPPPSALINIGGLGNGTFLITGGTTGAPAVQEQPGTRGTNLIIRGSSEGGGTLRGNGKVGISGEVVQNGQVIADGFGQKRTLDLTTSSRITNTIENPTHGGASGWYARNGGTLALPRIRVTSSDYSYTWGEESHDDTLDLVNSVRFRANAGELTSFVDISLLDPRSEDIPALPGGRDAIGLWSFDSSADLSDVSLTVRYDDALASQMHLSEDALRLWVFEDNKWQLVGGATAGIDTEANLIWGAASGDPTYFATAPLGAAVHPITQLVPEPSTLAIAALGAGSLLLRRRRGRRA